MKQRSIVTEILCLCLLGAGLYLLLSLWSFDPLDYPDRVYPAHGTVANLCGRSGAAAARWVFDWLGVAAGHLACLMLVCGAAGAFLRVAGVTRKPLLSWLRLGADPEFALMGGLLLLLCLASGEALLTASGGLSREWLAGRLAGGLWGSFLSRHLLVRLAESGSWLALAVTSAISGVLLVDVDFQRMAASWRRLWQRTREGAQQVGANLTSQLQAPAVAVQPRAAGTVLLPRPRRPREPVQNAPAAPPAPAPAPPTPPAAELPEPREPALAEAAPARPAEARAPETAPQPSAVSPAPSEEAALAEPELSEVSLPTMEKAARSAPAQGVWQADGCDAEAQDVIATQLGTGLLAEVRAQLESAAAPAVPAFDEVETQGAPEPEAEAAAAPASQEAPEEPELTEPISEAAAPEQTPEAPADAQAGAPGYNILSLAHALDGLLDDSVAAAQPVPAAQDSAEATPAVAPAEEVDNMVAVLELADALAAAEPVQPEAAEAELAEPEPAPSEALASEPAKETPAVPRPPLSSSSLRAQVVQEAPNTPLPPFELLVSPQPQQGTGEDDELQQQAADLIETLANFKIAAELVAITRGPVVTMFEIQIAAGIKVQKILGLSDDLAMGLRAHSVRIVAPIPKKSTIGVEIPNRTRHCIVFRDVIADELPPDRGPRVPLYLGTDAIGEPLVTDLTRMPHLLIAGATGSGKSVCINSILVSVLMTRTPEQVRLILIDPKMVELSLFEGIPHLLAPVITDMKKAPATLEWIVQKMESRYLTLSRVGVRNIHRFNSLSEREKQRRLDKRKDDGVVPDSLPYVVVVVDELADLMMVAGKEVEESIARLAQKSRAVGIHVILATQRPSVDVITGLIKSNMPARICFQVSSRIDSRTILDRNGGEKLLRNGDMLFMPPGTADLTRAQGALVEDEEVCALVDWWKRRGEPDYNQELINLEPPEDKQAGGKKGTRKSDPLYEKAVKILLSTGRGSVSLLQRKLEIGYTRAARLVDMMAKDGIVGEYKGSQARELLITYDEWIARQAEDDEEEED